MQVYFINLNHFGIQFSNKTGALLPKHPNPKMKNNSSIKAWAKQLSALLIYLKLNYCKDLDKIFVSSIKCPYKAKDVLLSHKTEMTNSVQF